MKTVVTLIAGLQAACMLSPSEPTIDTRITEARPKEQGPGLDALPPSELLKERVAALRYAPLPEGVVRSGQRKPEQMSPKIEASPEIGVTVTPEMKRRSAIEALMHMPGTLAYLESRASMGAEARAELDAQREEQRRLESELEDLHVTQGEIERVRKELDERRQAARERASAYEARHP